MSLEDNSKRAAEILAKLEEILVKASEAQVKADSEALRANQAKIAVEEHSNTVAKLKGAIEADAASVSAKKAELENQVQAVTNLRKSCESDTTSIASVRKTADEASKATIETSGKAAAVQAQLEEIKKSTDSLVQNVSGKLKTVEVEASQISSAKKSSDDLVQAILKNNVATSELHERAKTLKTAIEEIEKNSKSKFESLNNLVIQSEEIQKNVKGYEANLSGMEKDFAETLKKVEQLLPGATSAGLASSFCDQKKRFKRPQLGWMISFLSCIGLLLLLAIIEAVNHFSSSDLSWDLILRELVQRLPFVVPLVWLAIVSGRQYTIALRMEEEYAFKEATSTAFEGYKQQMISISEKTNGNITSINTLCENVLSSLSRRPGLIYEGKHHDVTPLTPAVDMIEKLGFVVAEGLKQTKDAALKPITDTIENVTKVLPKT